MTEQFPRLHPAPVDAILQVAERRDKLIVYAALLRRWLVRSGPGNPDLARQTERALFGEDEMV